MGNTTSSSPSPLDLEKDTQMIPNGRGGSIFCRHFPDVYDRPIAVLFYFHGLFLHSGVEAESRLCRDMALENRFHVVAFDHTGHGRSASDVERGHIENWNWFLDDATSVIHHTMSLQNLQNLPFFMFGISLGGCVAMNTAFKIQSDPLLESFCGSVLVAPAIYDNIRPNDMIVGALRFAYYFGGGYLALGPAADVNHFGSDEAFQLFKNDKYCYSGRLRLSMGHSLLSLTEHTQTILANVKFPFCLVHSTDDTVIKVDGSRELFAKSATPKEDKVYFEYTGYGHNVLIAQDALPRCFHWIRSRIKAYNLKKRASQALIPQTQASPQTTPSDIPIGMYIASVTGAIETTTTTATTGTTAAIVTTTMTTTNTTTTNTTTTTDTTTTETNTTTTTTTKQESQIEEM